ncbi:hypothetical protein ACSDQ9_00995 [Aestuariimicrobium soli]|uniref:LpxL/LpxP family acyltransferase n=1 Tax=Aestuariimicrobium soli TaxID=2035834 RepID=UPI003EC06127
MKRVPGDLRDQLVAGSLQAAGRVPWPVWRPMAGVAAGVLAARPNDAVRQWQANVAALTGAVPDRALTARALSSWARNTVTSLQLGRLSARQIVDRIVMDPEQEHRLRSTAATRGVVLALPHMGSWDLAGAWACAVGMPVATVAEELGRREFALFVRERERLGFTVYGHRDPTVTEKLVADSRANKLICLLVDRNFSRGGAPVLWPGPEPVPSRMPVGPAHVACESGALLMGLSSSFEGDRLRLQLSDPIEPDPAAPNRMRRYQAMMQQVCDFFADRVVERPEDWHMLQPVFTP